MYTGEPQTGADGKKYPLDGFTQIDQQKGMTLFNLMREAQPENSLEVGLAYGFSALYLPAALKANGKGRHIAIDQYQEWWKGIGQTHLSLVPGCECIPEDSAYALSRLIKEQKKFRFIFIDGDHRFEGALMDFFLAAQVCDIGGYTVLDDVVWKPVQKVADFIRTNREDFVERQTACKTLGVFQKIGTDNWDRQYFAKF